jgi:propionyl-CoA carboxylase alpha chain
VEEAPSPFVTPEMRKAMGEQAVELARKVGYFSAGTVEFIAGADRGFYFLEMNTRLQVEHPVTECITGLDLVEQMIRVAAGEKLSFGQADVKLEGHAIETRFYAEDPYRGFLPSIGRLTAYREPAEGNGVRVDTGVVEGSEISMFYDPMIAKLITHAPTRLEAADLQIGALDRYYVRGISHNADFLSALMQHPRFRGGELVTTAYIAEEYPEGFMGAPDDSARLPGVVALGAVIGHAAASRAAHVDGRLNGGEAGSNWVVELDGEQHEVALSAAGSDYRVTVDGKTIAVETGGHIPAFGVIEAQVDGKAFAVQVDRKGSGFLLVHHGRQHRMRLLTPRAASLAKHMLPKVAPDLSRFLLCPMPGLVVSIAVAEGDKVEAGQQLAVVEAMKMENILRAEKSGTVGKLHAKAGDSLAVDAVILEFDA